MSEPIEQRGGHLGIAESIREQRLRADHGHLVEGISALAVPIIPRSGDIAGSLAINMTSARLSPDRLPILLDLLRAEVRQIEELVDPEVALTT